MNSKNQGVLYLNVGCKHLAHLCVSLLSLRDVYDGPVAILSGGEESKSFLEKRILPEKRLGGIRIIEFEYKSHGRGSVYYAKTSMGDLSPFEKSVFIDSDTLVVGDFSKMWPDSNEVRLTQFADWNSQSKRINSRIDKWKDVLPKQVALQQSKPFPAVNTGVMGFSKGSFEFMKRWHQDTIKNIGFICDEICAQLIFPEYEHLMLSDQYNASPRFSWKTRGPRSSQKAVIWHGHGKKFLKNSPEVQEALWLPYYRRALENNIAGICEWTNDRRHHRGLVRPKKYLSEKQWESVTAGINVR